MALTRITKGVIKPNENYDTHNINSTGIVTATKFVGPFDDINVSGAATFTGSVSIGGTLTYEDVTNVDSVGIITARDGIHVGAGVSAIGIGTFKGGLDVDGNGDISGDLDVDGHTNLDNTNIVGMVTVTTSGDYQGPLINGNICPTVRFATNNNTTPLYKVGLSGNVGDTFAISDGATSNDRLTVNATKTTINGYLHTGNIQLDHKIYHTNDTNNSIEFGTDLQHFYTNGLERLKIQNSGIIVTGVSTFSASAHVSNASGSVFFGAGNATAYGSQGGIGRAGGSNYHIGSSAVGDLCIAAEGSKRILFGTKTGTGIGGVTKRMSIASSGQVTIDGNLDAVGGIDATANSTFAGNIDVDGHTYLDNVSISGITTSGNINISSSGPRITFSDTNENPDFYIEVNASQFLIQDASANAQRFRIQSNGVVDIDGNTNFSGGIDVTGGPITATGSEGKLSLTNTGSNATEQTATFLTSNSGTHNRIVIKTSTNNGGDPYIKFDAGGQDMVVGTRYVGTTNNLLVLGPGLNPDTTSGIFVKGTGNVGIGTDTMDSSADLSITNSGAARIYMKSGNDSDCSLIFGALDDAATGAIRYDHSDDSFRFYGYNNSEAMRITDGGDISIGGRDEALSNYAAGSTTTKLAVVEQSGGSGYSEVAHFTAGTDSNDTGAIVRITQFNNDRGLYIKGGRGTSDQAKAIFGLRNSGAVDSDVMTFIQGGNVGIGSGIPSKTLDVSGNIRCGNFTIDRHGDPTIMMTSTSDTGGGSIYFGSPASGVRGGILYDHNGDKLQFRNIYGTSIEITNDRISTFYGDINIQKGSAYPSANLKIQSHDTANATSRIQFLARDNSNNNETCYIQANSGSTASVDLRFGTDTGEHLRITRNGQLWLYANGGDNQFNSKRTGATSSNGDYYFHLQAINNVDQTVGVLGFHRHTGNDDARFVIHTKQSGVAKEERMRIHADGTVQFSATAASDQNSADNRQVFEIGSVGDIKLGNTTDQRRATPADRSRILGLRAPNILDWGRDRGTSTYQAGQSITNFTGTWTSWTLNGTGTGNKWKLGQGPHGAMEWLWSGKSAYNDSTSGQGGWNTSLDVDPNYSYMFITYVKRVSSTNSGNFYVGTGGVAAQGSGATSGLSNPYWTCGSVNNLDRNVWHVCVHYVLSYHSSNTNQLPNAGTYRMSDGSRIANGANCNVGNGPKFNTTQTGHSCVYRSYLFYSTQNDGTELHWAQPHAYKCDGTEPTLMELLGRELANSDDSDNWDG